MSDLPELTLPPIDARVEWRDGMQQIWDAIRKQWVALTPEEWVRQHFAHLLVHSLRYPRSLIKIESGLHYLKKRKRSDMQVLTPAGNVFLLVECKAPSVKLNEQTLKQVAEYNKTLQASYLSITNGIKHFVWKYEVSQNKYQSIDEFPVFTYD